MAEFRKITMGLYRVKKYLKLGDFNLALFSLHQCEDWIKLEKEAKHGR